MTDQEMAKQIEFLAKENRQLRKSGCKLSEAALYVAREYDGVHRLMSAVSDWTMTIANEGGRGKRSDSVTVGDDGGEQREYIYSRVMKIPGDNGFWKSACENAYKEAADKMLEAGLPPDEIVELLDRLYWSTADCYGD